MISPIRFWFFAARKNPDTAPLVLWFNGGVSDCLIWIVDVNRYFSQPGESSMAGLMQEHGPCRINNDSHTVSPNEYSWNERVNMLYIDQPVGVGFSTGNRTISTTAAAAADVWNFTQIWLSDPRFLRYQSRDLGIWTESYVTMQWLFRTLLMGRYAQIWWPLWPSICFVSD